MVAYSGLEVDAEYLIQDFYIGNKEWLDVRVRVVAFCPDSVCFAMTFYDDLTGQKHLFSATPYLRAEFRDYLRSHPLCRRSKRLKSNSMVVPFRCADFLGQLVALEE